MSKQPPSKLDYTGRRVDVAESEAYGIVCRILSACGCSAPHAEMIAAHLVDASLCGVESHGIMRVIQYHRQFGEGYMKAGAEPCLAGRDGAFLEIDGGGGHGIPAMNLAFDEAVKATGEAGITVTTIVNVGHTGRHGAYAERTAEAGMMSVLLGGGNRRIWRQVAPHGGTEARLPTNPWCVGLPGGGRGPFVMDFATSKIAGGWIYAAKSAGARLPDGCLIDSRGRPSNDPDAYFEGGAILPAAGQKGYALALAAELVAEALVGPVSTECNWLLIMLDTARMAAAKTIRARAEDVLSDMRDCPPANGHEAVEIPGERERGHRARSGGVIAVPESTWDQILALAGIGRQQVQAFTSN